VNFSLDLSIFAVVFSSLAMAQKLVRTLHNRLKIIEEIMEKNLGEKRVDITK
jgi:heme exporter protein D